jgi:phloretin hydrolase
MNDRSIIPGLTPEERALPYSGYYYMKPAPVPEKTLDRLSRGPMHPGDALPFERINELLEPGYAVEETGYCIMPDGTGYAAMLTPMPGVTGAMLDWWFAWHPLEDLRYRIWYPGAHIANRAEFPGRLVQKSLPFKERYMNNTNYPVEDIGTGIEELSIRFVPPEEFNFATACFERARVATVLCAIVGWPARKLQHTRMVHFVRNTANGVEMRSRFWIGYRIRWTGSGADSILNRALNTRTLKGLLIKMNVARSMAYHCAQEYANLASILPPLYERFGAE